MDRATIWESYLRSPGYFGSLGEEGDTLVAEYRTIGNRIATLQVQIANLHQRREEIAHSLIEDVERLYRQRVDTKKQVTKATTMLQRELQKLSPEEKEELKRLLEMKGD
jgi:cell division protein FtsB